MTISIRAADERDIPQMASIRAQEWETEDYWIVRITSYLSPRQQSLPYLASRAVFVAIEKDQVVGFVAGHRTSRHGCDGELQWINVSKESRGRGIAQKLLAWIGEWFVEQQMRRICVDVTPENLTARRLYAKSGAKPLKPSWMVWEDAQTMCGAAGKPPPAR